MKHALGPMDVKESHSCYWSNLSCRMAKIKWKPFTTEDNKNWRLLLGGYQVFANSK